MYDMIVEPLMVEESYLKIVCPFCEHDELFPVNPTTDNGEYFKFSNIRQTPKATFVKCDCGNCEQLFMVHIAKEPQY